MNIRDHKIEMRKDIERKRTGLSTDERMEKERHICDRLLSVIPRLLTLVPSDHKRTILTYMPFRTEPDVTPLMEWCWKEGIHVLLPRSIPETRGLILHRVDGYDGVATGAYGIREPKINTPVEGDLSLISLIIVPGLAFDRNFYRLGYGGGYYDRFMQLFASRGLDRPLTVAAAFDAQIVNEVPASWHDFRVDHIVTESLHWIKP